MTTRTLAVLALFFASLVGVSHAETLPPTLVVTGSGSAEVEPDQLEVSFAIESVAEQTEDAMEDNAERSRRVITALERAGVEEDDIETVGFNVSPEYDYSNRRNGEPARITGYKVYNTIRVRTLDLTKSGELIETGVRVGADRVSGLGFGLADPQAHRAKAIAEATSNARRDAEALAQAAGLELAGILEITLDPEQGVRPYAARMEMGAMASAAPEIRAGDVSLTARVRIVYEVRTAR